MGETKKSAQDNPLEPGLSSGETEGSTPEPETPTLTETQAKARETKAVSDALATAGRTAKKFEGREAAIKAREEAAEARQKAIDDAELDAIKGDPDLEAQYRRKQEATKREKALAEREQKQTQKEIEHQADIDAANASKREIAIWEIAQKYGVDANALKELNLDTPEQMESVAKAMAAGKAAPGSEPDSGKTIGGMGTPTLEQLDKMTPEQYAAWRKIGSK